MFALCSAALAFKGIRRHGLGKRANRTRAGFSVINFEADADIQPVDGTEVPDRRLQPAWEVSRVAGTVVTSVDIAQ